MYNNGFCGGNMCWIIILLILFCGNNGIYGGNYANGCGNGCGNFNHNCGCDNNCGCC